MKVLLLAMLAIVGCVACVGPIKAGPYPRGFTTGSQMHYIHPRVARVLYGRPAPIPDPLATGYVETDADGNVYVSPQLAKQLKP